MSGDPLPERLVKAFNAFEDYLRVERGAAQSTIRSYRRDVRRYLRHLAESGIADPGEVKPGHIADALGKLANRGAAPSTINRALAAIRHFHRFCIRDGLAHANPAALVDGPARGLALPKALEADEVTAIIEAASGSSPRELRDRAMLELLYGGGVRVSELVGLDVADIDLEERTIRCLGKGDKERIVPIGHPARDALRRYLREGRPELVSTKRSSSALFLNVRGGRLSRQSAWKCVKTYSSRVAGGKHVFPHALRHSFATHLVAGGADIRVVQEALGHARLSTTQVYTLVSRKTLKDVFERAHPRGRRREDDRAASE